MTRSLSETTGRRPLAEEQYLLEVGEEVLGTCACGQPATLEAYSLVPGPEGRCVPTDSRLLCNRCNLAELEAIVARVNAHQEARP
jgi:hypothetical protein